MAKECKLWSKLFPFNKSSSYSDTVILLCISYLYENKQSILSQLLIQKAVKLGNTKIAYSRKMIKCFEMISDKKNKHQHWVKIIKS